MAGEGGVVQKVLPVTGFFSKIQVRTREEGEVSIIRPWHRDRQRKRYNAVPCRKLRLVRPTGLSEAHDPEVDQKRKPPRQHDETCRHILYQ